MYEAVNLSLDFIQKANIQAIANLDISLQETNEAYLELKEEPELEVEYTLIEIIKNVIKLLVIVGVVLCVFVAFGALMSGKLLNSEDAKNCFQLRVIGQLSIERVKKPFAFVSHCFSAFGGITAVPEDYNRLAKMIGSSLKSDLTSNEESNIWKKITFTGTISEEEMKKGYLQVFIWILLIS